MADELNKKNPNFNSGSSSESAPKPKTIGTPAPNVPKPKQTPTTKPQLAPKEKAAPLSGSKVQPGSPFRSESTPVGIQRKRFESDKHKVKFNPNLNYKPSKEQIEAANRKKIMNQGFAPKNWDGKSDVEAGIDFKVKPDVKNNFDKIKDLKPGSKYFQVYEKREPGWGKNYYEDYFPTIEEAQEYAKNYKGNYDLHIGEMEVRDNGAHYNVNDQKYQNPEAEKESKPNKNYVKENGLIKVVDEKGRPTGEQYPSQESAEDVNTSIDNWNELENEQRSKASELYGTDLNKQQGYDYDRLSKELDSGDMVNLDGGLLPYEYGFETNGYEDLAVDARKNPETGKYEVFMYPETEDGPVEEPDENYPDYEFDSFDDLKAFMENNYKKVETPKYDPMNEPGSGGVTKELVDFVRQQLKADGGLNDNFIDAYLSKMPQNSNQADYWKGKMKEAWDKKNGGKNNG